MAAELDLAERAGCPEVAEGLREQLVPGALALGIVLGEPGGEVVLVAHRASLACLRFHAARARRCLRLRGSSGMGMAASSRSACLPMPPLSTWLVLPVLSLPLLLIRPPRPARAPPGRRRARARG